MVEDVYGRILGGIMSKYTREKTIMRFVAKKNGKQTRWLIEQVFDC